MSAVVLTFRTGDCGMVSDCSYWADRIPHDHAFTDAEVLGEIGVLSIDNGEYNVYAGYFSDVDRLRAAVEKLNAERRDLNTDELVDAEVHVERLIRIPTVIGDDFLDILAGLLDGAGCEVESARQRDERLREEAEELERERQLREGLGISTDPSPGQMQLGDE